MNAISERDQARTERDRARDTLSKIRGIVVALKNGVGSPDAAIASIMSILHVDRRRGVRSARRTAP